MCREKQWTISSIFCLLNPEFIQVALNSELHKVFWTIPRSAIEFRGQRECKTSFTFINFWRKHQITNPFIPAHTAEEHREAMARTRPAPARCYQKSLVRCLIQPLLGAPQSLLGSLTRPVGDTTTTKEPLISTLKLSSNSAVFSEQWLNLGDSRTRARDERLPSQCQVISD